VAAVVAAVLHPALAAVPAVDWLLALAAAAAALLEPTALYQPALELPQPVAPFPEAYPAAVPAALSVAPAAALAAVLVALAAVLDPVRPVALL
jgi:hypothetical protein